MNAYPCFSFVMSRLAKFRKIAIVRSPRALGLFICCDFFDHMVS
jgi:hypothetical protein